MKKYLPITVTTGEQHEGYAAIRDFFEETRDEILRRGYPEGPHFEIRERELSHQEGHATDERIHILFYRDAAAATVLETRTSLNLIRFDFFISLENILDRK